MPKLVKTLQLPVKLVELAKQHFNTDNASIAIRLCIEFAVLRCLTELHSHSLKIYHLLSIEERRTRRSYSVRLDKYVLDAICGVTEKSLNEAVIDAMVHTVPLKSEPESESELDSKSEPESESELDSKSEPDSESEPNSESESESDSESESSETSLKLISLLGSKWDKRMQSAIEKVLTTSDKNWNKTVETCVGALGIHANFNIAGTEIINDDDIEKINLYECIRQKAFEFKAKALLFECTEEAFKQLKCQKYTDTKIPNVDRAVRYFLLNIFSVRNSGDCYNIKASKKTLYKRLEAVASLSKRLKNVQIFNLDIFDIIKKHKKDRSVLFIVDPIYLDTNVYKCRTLGTKTEHGADFGWKEHQRLAKELRSIKGDFIYFCRITATRHKNSKNKNTDSLKEIEKKDIEMLGRIDDLYWGYGFYYIDVPLNNGTIERIITSFKFEDSTPYGKTSESEGK